MCLIIVSVLWGYNEAQNDGIHISSRVEFVLICCMRVIYLVTCILKRRTDEYMTHVGTSCVTCVVLLFKKFFVTVGHDLSCTNMTCLTSLFYYLRS